LELSHSLEDPLNLCLLQHCLPELRKHSNRILKNIPDVHKKAIIASYIAANTIYKYGLGWEPSINQVLQETIKNILKTE
jgi:glutamate dehydrogenase